MSELTFIATESHELADAFYKAIKECPFERNKDLTNWTEASILYGIVSKQFSGQIPTGSNTIGKLITIEDPDPAITDDPNSYLVVELVTEHLDDEGYKKRVGITYKFPVEY